MSIKPPTITIAQQADYPSVAELFAAQNATRSTRCLHSHEGSVEATLHSMNQYTDDGEFALVLARDDAGNVVGAFGGEYDPTNRRVWLWGPMAVGADNEPETWLDCCQQMYELLVPSFPFEPAILDGFIDQPFELGAQLYQRCGHHLAKTIYVLVAPRPEEITPPDIPHPPLTAAHSDSFAQLFEQIFPDTYYTGAQIAARQLETERTFIHLDGDAVTGFCHVKFNEGPKDGYVEFVGVHPDARRRGIARQLLTTGMHWLFTTHNVPEIGLTTGDDNINAQALYVQVGFEIESVGLAYRKTEG